MDHVLPHLAPRPQQCGAFYNRLPQSSSASRFTAGASGFLNFSQSFVLPDRYCEPSRFETIPSSPSLQA
jgi:hypothetical protein